MRWHRTKANPVTLTLAGALMTLPTTYGSRGQPDTGGGRAVAIDAFWPASKRDGHWSLIERSERGSRQRKVLMSVRNQSVNESEFLLWFSQKAGQAAGAEDGERYRICRAKDLTWLILDEYLNRDPAGNISYHPVKADRALLYVPGKPPEELIQSGILGHCADRGQPYLIWAGGPAAYRISVWGHLRENRNWHWFWDASIKATETVVDDCLKPPKEFAAMQVQEAWWSNFHDFKGKWGLGSGSLTGSGEPSGQDIEYGRTIWHGEGKTPYLMTGNSKGGRTWCSIDP